MCPMFAHDTFNFINCAVFSAHSTSSYHWPFPHYSSMSKTVKMTSLAKLHLFLYMSCRKVEVICVKKRSIAIGRNFKTSCIASSLDTTVGLLVREISNDCANCVVLTRVDDFSIAVDTIVLDCTHLNRIRRSGPV